MRILLQDIKTSGHRIEYARHLIKYFIRSGHDVYYCTRGHDNRLQQLRELGATVDAYSEQPAITSISDFPSHQMELYQYYRSVFATAEAWNADIVHQLYLESSENMLLLSLLTKIRPDWLFFGTYFSKRLITPSTSLAKSVFRYTRRFSVKTLIRLGLLENIFVLHESMRRELADRLPIDEKFISVVPDPINPPTIERCRSAARNALGLPENDTILLFFGATRYNKGADILLDSLSLLDEENVTVVFAGPADAVSHDDIAHAEPNISPGINIISRFEFIPDDQIYQYFIASDAVCLPYRSEYQGTSGILQRAIASHRPVIGTDCGIVSSIIRQWETGLVVQPDSPSEFARGIESFLQDEEQYQNLSDRANEYIKKHHWENFAEQVLNTYRRCYNGRF